MLVLNVKKNAMKLGLLSNIQQISYQKWGAFGTYIWPLPLFLMNIPSNPAVEKNCDETVNLPFVLLNVLEEQNLTLSIDTYILHHFSWRNQGNRQN